MKKVFYKRGVAAMLLAVALSLPAMGQHNYVTKHGRMDRTKLNVGAYILRSYAHSEQHVADVAACGIDFMTSIDANDRATLDLFQKYHIGAVVSGVMPGWWGGNGKNAGTMHKANPLQKYEVAAAAFKDHPAIWGVDIGDEPSALDFPYYGKVMARVEEIMPNQFAYLNLYPNYASIADNSTSEVDSQLGTRSYGDYIAEYCKDVPSDYICYDHYPYSSSIPLCYENLRIVADAAQSTGRSMWIVLQVNSRDTTKWISLNQLRFQAYTAMAFGAENIIWACYTGGWWSHNVLDAQGNKTQQYDKLKAMNAELHKLGPVYMKYRKDATAFIGFDCTKWLAGVKQAAVSRWSVGVFSQVRATDGSPLVAGHFRARKGDDASQALLVMPADDPYDQAPRKHTVRFAAPSGTTVTAYDGKGKLNVRRHSGNQYSVSLQSNQGALIVAK